VVWKTPGFLAELTDVSVWTTLRKMMWNPETRKWFSLK
jgi:hypothetical protein